jgi:gliding motility-associated-like protein
MEEPYQWKVNGANVGTNSATYTSSTLANADQVSVVMTSNAPCASPLTATSNVVTMSAASSVTPSVSIVASSTSICSGQSVTFTATPTNGGATPSYQWKVNGANVGTNSATYTSSTLANADQVSVVMSSSDPCASPASVSSTAITMTTSSVSATANAPDIPCGQSSGSILINASRGITPYAFSIDGGVTFQSTNSFNNLVPGSYSIRVKDNSGCTTDLPVVLKSTNAPNIKITDPSPSCSAVDITFPAIITGSDAELAYTYWSNSSATIPVTRPDSISTQGIYYIKGINTSGCFNIKPVIVSINPKPNVSIVNPPAICKPNTVDLTLNSITVGSDNGLIFSYWNDSLANSAISNPNTINQSGNYFIEGTNSFGCYTTKRVVVTIINNIPGIRYPAQSALLNSPIPLSSRSIGNNSSYQWSPNDGLDFSTVKDPVFNYDRSIDYQIKITSEAGCVTIDSLLVNVTSANNSNASAAFVPKAWSPNGDGHNDYLFPFLVNIQTLKSFKVFNRWGELMFETSERRKGWNGFAQNKQQAMDVYTWTIEAVGIDGRVYKNIGTAVLIR